MTKLLMKVKAKIEDANTERPLHVALHYSSSPYVIIKSDNNI
jgi:hypothetical protein